MKMNGMLRRSSRRGCPRGSEGAQTGGSPPVAVAQVEGKIRRVAALFPATLACGRPPQTARTDGVASADIAARESTAGRGGNTAQLLWMGPLPGASLLL